MDRYDESILQVLIKDSRASLTQLGRKTGLSRFAVKNRIVRLYENGTILGPTVIIDPRLVGINRTVFFELKTNPHEPWLAKMLEDSSFCDLLDGIAGEFSLVARFRLIDDEHFSKTLKKVDEAMGGSYFKKYRVVNAIKIFKESGVALQTERKKPVQIDETDLRILEILLNQADLVKSPLPLSTVELSRQLHASRIEISQPAVFNRISRLEERGVILQHAVRVDCSKLGLHTKFIIRIKANPTVYDAVAQGYLAHMPEILDLYRTGEEYGLLATVRLRDVVEYNSFLLRLYGSEGVIDTHTTLVLEERKNSPISLRRD